MKTLVVSENKAEVEVLRRILKHNFRELEFVSAGSRDEVESTLLSDGPFGFFIMDAELKHNDPNELSHSILDISGEKPFLFIGQSAAITDRISQELYQSNIYNDQVYKPFDRNDVSDDIKNKVKSILDWAKQEEFEASIEQVNPLDFIQMKLRNFYFMNTFPYDIYLEITQNEYIKIISANKPYSISTLDIYAKKNIKNLYIKKDYHLEYLEDEAFKCTKLIKKINPASQDFYIILLRSITILHQYLLALGTTLTASELMDEIVEGVLKLESQYPKLSVALKKFPKHYTGIASKSLLCAILSIHVSKLMGWESRTTKMKMAISSVLQDFSLPIEEMAKINYPNDSRLIDYTDEEIELYYQHPIIASNIARQFSKYPDIDYILELHQELPFKKGFPNQVNHSRISAVNCVFNICQFAASEMDGLKFTNDNIALVLKTMSRDFSQGNFKVPFDLLKSAL